MPPLPVPIGGAVVPAAGATDALAPAAALGPELIGVAASARAYMAADSADATRRAYAADWRHFAGWCGHHGFGPLPAAPAVLAGYLAALADAKLKASTIGRRVAAIGDRHRRAGHASPGSHPDVQSVLSGIRRTIGTRVDRKAPVTARIAKAMCKPIPATPAASRDRALLLLGFATAMRRSELVALDVADIERVPEGIWVHIRRSKTDQEGAGRPVPVPRGNRLKPIEALDAWLAAAGITDGPLFRRVGKGGRVSAERLRAESVGDIVKRWAEAAGFDPRLFGGHSLRAGFVTEALGNGADALAIMKITGHRQVATLEIYDRRAKGFAEHAGRKFL